MTVNISLEELLASSAHFGHQARRWNPKMSPYIYGQKEGVHIFDLVKTKECLLAACDYLEKASREGKTILLVGTKKQAKEKVIAVAQLAGIPYVSERWLGGTFTNFEQIKRSIEKLSDMQKKTQAGEYAKFTKFERLLIEREIQRLQRFLGGIKGLTKLPDVIIIIDVHKEIGCLKEARKMGIPIIGVVDSNSDPTDVLFPIPMNDDSETALSYVIEKIGEAVLSGKKGVGLEKEEKEIKKTKKVTARKEGNTNG